MFNNSLKKEALEIHRGTLERYNKSYKEMSDSCESLYDVRVRSIGVISLVQRVIDSIANTPKEFEKELGKIGSELIKFKETEEYAKEAYTASVKASVDIAGGAIAGIGVASMAPSALMSIATTFGTASTGIAISELTGAAAQKAAVSWIGRTFAGFAVKKGAGMAAGKAFLALAGPVGWGITAATTGFSLLSFTKKNQRIADEAVAEAKEISIAREALDETNEKIKNLKSKTFILYSDMDKEKTKILDFMNLDYITLSDEEKMYLGKIVNNTLVLSVYLNKTIE